MRVCFILLFLALTPIFSNAQDGFRWLVGSWKQVDRDAYEIWEQSQDASLRGKSFRVKGGDTLVTETIELKKIDGSYFYVPDVSGDQPAINFRISRYDNSGFVAENPHHDFPKVIRYELKRSNGVDMLEAKIEGDGKAVSYVFQRIK